MNFMGGGKWVASGVCALALSLAAVSWPSPAAAQPTVDALRWLRQYHNDLAAMSSAANNVPGPYTLGDSCSWCANRPWWAFGKCTETAGESWNTVLELTGSREGLVRIVVQARQTLQDFGPSYTQVQDWINGLGPFSQSFDATADRILAVGDEIRAGNGPTDQQREVVAVALKQLTDGVTNVATQMRAATSPLAAQLQQQGVLRVQIRQEMINSDTSAKAAIVQAQANADAHPCKNGIPERFAGIRSDVDQSRTGISDAFNAMESSSRASEAALAALLAIVLDSQTDLQTVLALLAATGKDQLAGFLQRLHLNAAKKQWRELAMRGG